MKNTTNHESRWNHRTRLLATTALASSAVLAGCALDNPEDEVDGVELDATPQNASAANTTRTRTFTLPADLSAIPGSMGYPGRTSPEFTQPDPIEVPSHESIRNPDTGMCISSPVFSRNMGRSVLQHLPQPFLDYLEYGMVNPPATAQMLPPTDDRMKVREFMDDMGPETAYGVRFYRIVSFDPVTKTMGPPGPLHSCVETYSGLPENPATLVPHFHIAIKDNLKDVWGNYVRQASNDWQSLLDDPTWLNEHENAPYLLERIGSLEDLAVGSCTSTQVWNFQHAGGADTLCTELHDEKVYEFDPLGSCPSCYKGGILNVLTIFGLWALERGWMPAFHYEASAPDESGVELEPASWDEETGFVSGPLTKINAIPRSKLSHDEQLGLAKNEFAWRVSEGLPTSAP